MVDAFGAFELFEEFEKFELCFFKLFKLLKPSNLLADVVHVRHANQEIPVFQAVHVEVAQAVCVAEVEADFAFVEEEQQAGAGVEAEIETFIGVETPRTHLDAILGAVGSDVHFAFGSREFDSDFLATFASEAEREAGTQRHVSADIAAAEVFLHHNRDVEVVERFFLAVLDDLVISRVAEFGTVPEDGTFTFQVDAALREADFRLQSEAVAEVDFCERRGAKAGTELRIVNVVVFLVQLESRKTHAGADTEAAELSGHQVSRKQKHRKQNQIFHVCQFLLRNEF